MNDIEYLIKKYDEHCKIVPIHMTDNVRLTFEKKFFTPPIEGDEFNI